MAEGEGWYRGATAITMREPRGPLPLCSVEGWTAPAVRAAQTTRGLAVSAPGARADVVPAARAAFNLARHVGDDPQAVDARRHMLRRALGVERIIWLEQVHGNAVHVAVGTEPESNEARSRASPRADAVVTAWPGVACAVMTADCLPILFATRDGAVVGAIHAGWRGLAAGVVEAALDAARRLWADCERAARVEVAWVGAARRRRSRDDADRQIGARPVAFEAWIGPAIGQKAFEVGPEVREALIDADRRAASAALTRSWRGREPVATLRWPAVEAAFQRGAGDRWHADLAALAWRRLAREGAAVSLSGSCTFDDAAGWYSHRRDPASGRQASLIWRTR